MAEGIPPRQEIQSISEGIYEGIPPAPGSQRKEKGVPEDILLTPRSQSKAGSIRESASARILCQAISESKVSGLPANLGEEKL